MTAGDPRIFYFCYQHNIPRGGQKHTYRHVDILNANGFDAAVFHPGEDFRLTWFENQTRVIGYSEFIRAINPDRDFVVLPEDLGGGITDFPGRKVIFNKNTFKGFECFGTDEIHLYPYQSLEVVAAFAVSEHNQRQLQFTYPDLQVEKVDIEIDPAIFSFCALEKKAPIIVCAMKSKEILLPVYHMVQARAAANLNRGREFQWVFLDHYSEQETARILHDALLFLFLNVAEGIGRMPLEAMASGCIVASYDYGPLGEALKARSRFEYGDPISVVKFIEEVMALYPTVSQERILELEEGREIATHYSLANQEAGVMSAWKRILSRAMNSRNTGQTNPSQSRLDSLLHYPYASLSKEASSDSR